MHLETRLSLFLLLCIAFVSAATDIQSVVHKLVASRGDGKEEEAKLWRQLGKIQLDSREYAEARLLFCEGARRCPWDEGLVHHERVFNAFHGVATSKEGTRAPPPPLAMPQATGDGMFLSLDVPTENQIPKSIQNWKGKVPSSKRTRLVHASKEPILSKEACQFLIDSARDAVNDCGWTKDRHVQAPTCDIPVFELATSAKEWCRRAFHDVLFPMLTETVSPELDIDPTDFRIQDCFIVRYDGNADDNGPGFSQLIPHEDESLLSLTIALNDMAEYEGGGLFIQSTGDLLNGDAGTVLCFAGGLVHGGYPLTRGTRWILTVFIYADANESGKKPGYTVEMVSKELEKAKL